MDLCALIFVGGYLIFLSFGKFFFIMSGMDLSFVVFKKVDLFFSLVFVRGIIVVLFGNFFKRREF